MNACLSVFAGPVESRKRQGTLRARPFVLLLGVLWLSSLSPALASTEEPPPPSAEAVMPAAAVAPTAAGAATKSIAPAVPPSASVQSPQAAPAPAAATAPVVAKSPAPVASSSQQVASALWSAASTELPDAALSEAIKSSVRLLPGGPRAEAGQTVAAARRAVLELRCGDALASLQQASQRLLSELPLPDSRESLAEVHGLMLMCADRLNDQERATQAAAILRAVQVPLPSDVALILKRYPEQGAFGPPRPPVQVETDPPGAMVLRNLVPIGVTPVAVPGGNPLTDVLDIESPGMRKLRRPLDSNTQLVLALRPEDRLPVWVDRIAALPLGSDPQAALLSQLAETPLPADAIAGRKILVFGPKQRSGAPVAGEPLQARLFDLTTKQWLGPTGDVPSGAGTQQASQLVAMAQAGSAAATVRSVVAGAATPLADKQPASARNKNAMKDSGSKLPLSRVKWYTWVVAGGVVALIAGLLISEKVSDDKVTISASR